MSCPDCFKGSVHDHGTPTGTLQNLHGYRTYVAEGNAATRSPSTIVYLPDAFSLKLINNKLLADRYAKETGCRVLLPDIIPNGGMDVVAITYLDDVTTPAGLNPFAWLRRTLALVALLYHAIPFMLTATPTKVYRQTLAYTRAVKADLPTDAKLGVCGFCWGGYGATLMCTETVAEGSTKRLIDASFTAHPSFLKGPGMVVDAVTKYRTPYSCAVAEKDHQFSAKVAAETEAALRQKTASERGEYELVIHQNCKHGFAVRAHLDDKAEVQGYEDAARQAVNWFKRFLL